MHEELNGGVIAMIINVKRIETLIAEKGITKKILAEKSSISAQTLSTILQRGTCEPKTAGKIAGGLCVSVSEITAQ